METNVKIIISKLYKGILIGLSIITLVGCSKTTDLARDGEDTLDIFLEEVENNFEDTKILKKELADTLEGIEYELLELNYTFDTQGGKVYSKYTEFIVRDSKGDIQILKYNVGIEDMWISSSDRGYSFIKIVALEEDYNYKGERYNAGVLNIEIYYK